MHLLHHASVLNYKVSSVRLSVYFVIPALSRGERRQRLWPVTDTMPACRCVSPPVGGGRTHEAADPGDSSGPEAAVTVSTGHIKSSVWKVQEQIEICPHHCCVFDRRTGWVCEYVTETVIETVFIYDKIWFSEEWRMPCMAGHVGLKQHRHVLQEASHKRDAEMSPWCQSSSTACHMSSTSQRSFSFISSVLPEQQQRSGLFNPPTDPSGLLRLTCYILDSSGCVCVPTDLP